MKSSGMHLAEVNIGRLVATPDDPRVAEFVSNLDKVNNIAKSMDGFIWMMEGEQDGNINNPINDDDPCLAFNLSVWKDVTSLDRYVWGTVHRQFYNRRAEWFDVFKGQHFAMWWVPIGHTPSKEEALDRIAHREAQGDSNYAFGWSWLKEATLWRERQCTGNSENHD